MLVFTGLPSLWFTCNSYFCRSDRRHFFSLFSSTKRKLTILHKEDHQTRDQLLERYSFLSVARCKHISRVGGHTLWCMWPYPLVTIYVNQYFVLLYVFSFILLIHEGSHMEVYQEFQPSYDVFRRWCQGLFRAQIPCTPSLHSKIFMPDVFPPSKIITNFCYMCNSCM